MSDGVYWGYSASIDDDNFLGTFETRQDAIDEAVIVYSGTGPRSFAVAEMHRLRIEDLYQIDADEIIERINDNACAYGGEVEWSDAISQRDLRKLAEALNKTLLNWAEEEGHIDVCLKVVSVEEILINAST